MSFQKYMHIRRVGSGRARGILDGKCYIFPKIDGTNASVWFDNDKLCAGSRNRQLTVEKDNAGFYKWVLKQQDDFDCFFADFPDLRLYGEWLVPHDQFRGILQYRDRRDQA